VYTGSFIALFNPFAILCGALSVAMSIFMGGSMLMNRGQGELYMRAKRLAIWSGLVALALFTLCGIWVVFMDGYQLVESPDPALAQTPLQQVVKVVSGAWLANFNSHPMLWLVPLSVYATVLLGIEAARRQRSHLAWWLGALGWIGIIGTVGAAMFPFMMPSSLEPSHSLTVWNASSSQLTLIWMTGFSAVFVPLILWYTSWAFWVMRGKVSESHVASDEHAY
jgi:cytochrome d ubiquinol oxidase subunit II